MQQSLETLTEALLNAARKAGADTADQTIKKYRTDDAWMNRRLSEFLVVKILHRSPVDPTEHLIDEPDEPTRHALDQVLDLFRTRLLTSN